MAEANTHCVYWRRSRQCPGTWSRNGCCDFSIGSFPANIAPPTIHPSAKIKYTEKPFNTRAREAIHTPPTTVTKDASDIPAPSEALRCINKTRPKNEPDSSTPTVSPSPASAREARCGATERNTAQHVTNAAVSSKPTAALPFAISRKYSGNRSRCLPEPYTAYGSRIGALCRPERNVN